MSRLQHKRGRKSNYAKSISTSEAHKIARQEVLKRDNFQCRICGSKNELEMHHISYSILGKEDMPESKKWLVMLCSTCHKQAHSEPTHKFNPKNKLKLFV